MLFRSRRLVPAALVLLGLGLTTTGSAVANGEATVHLKKGEYGQAAVLFEAAWKRTRDPSRLFNAAFYFHRAGEGDRARGMFATYLESAGCAKVSAAKASEGKALGKDAVRRIRKCAIAYELTGDFSRAEALLAVFTRASTKWAARSRAVGRVELVRLRAENAKLRAENAALKARAGESKKGQ